MPKPKPVQSESEVQTEVPPVPPVVSETAPEVPPAGASQVPPVETASETSPQEPSKEGAPVPESFGQALEAQEKKRGRGRPPKAGTGEAPPKPKGATEDVEAKKLRQEFCRKSGVTAANMLLGALATFGGPGYVLDPKKENEKQAIEMAQMTTGEYFVYKNWGDMPPGMALCVGWGMVAIAIANKEENKPKVAAWKERIFAWVQTKKAERATRKAEAA